MAAHNELGKKGEDLAADFLASQGFHIVSRNWRFRQKEIDIVAFDGPTLVFVEVKTRSSPSSPNDLIYFNKIRFLRDAAEAYILTTNFQGDARFDLVLLSKNRGSFDLQHIPAAFR